MIRVRSYPVVAVLLTASALCADTAPALEQNSVPAAQAVCHSATLRNGFSIEYVRSEVEGTSTRLWLSAETGASYVVIPTAQIERFEEWQNPKKPVAAISPASALDTPASAPPPANVPVKNLIANAAARHHIDPDFVASLVKAESGFNPAAVSPKGARGLMQLMPLTAASLGVENALDPASNMEGGTRYLRELLDQYGGDAAKALAAYNAGPQRVQQYGGVPPYAETRAYVARIIGDYNRKKLQQRAESAAVSAAK